MLNRALKLIRTFHEMDQTTLAKKLGISRSYLSELEGGSKTPSLEILERYSTVFHVPASSLLLLSENLADNRLSERVRVAGARKILRIMEWMAARNEEEMNSPEADDESKCSQNESVA